MKMVALWMLSMAPLCASSPLPADIAAIQAKLMSQTQLRVTGEQAYFIPADAAKPFLFERFSLQFERTTQRLLLSYSRFTAVGQRTDIQAWGTLDCLNMLRAEHSPPGLIQAKSQSCVHLDPLYSMLSEGTPIASAPVVLLSTAIRDTFFSSTANQPHRTISTDHQGDRISITLCYDNLPNEVAHYWLNAAAGAIEKVDATSTGSRLRATYAYGTETLTDKDFAFTPDAELATFAAIGNDPRTARAQLERLAQNGSKAAQLQLAYSSDQTVALMFFGFPRGNPEMTEQGWTSMEGLAKQGFGSAYLVQARWLARVTPDDLPARFKDLPQEKRRQQAREYFWMAAKACDMQALADLPRALSMGDEIFEPNPLKLAEFQTVKAHCDEVLAAPELKSAAAHFADPWP
jgi:hypothetical protein